MEAIEWRPCCEGTTQWRTREMHCCTNAVELHVAMMHTANFCISGLWWVVIVVLLHFWYLFCMQTKLMSLEYIWNPIAQQFEWSRDDDDELLLCSSCRGCTLHTHTHAWIDIFLLRLKKPNYWYRTKMEKKSTSGIAVAFCHLHLLASITFDSLL
jgi:hypothetical protein